MSSHSKPVPASHAEPLRGGNLYRLAIVGAGTLKGKEVAEVMRRYKATDRLIIAFDTDQETLDAIRDGTIAATIAQKPATMTYVGAMMLDNLHHHMPRSINTYWINDPFAPVPAHVDTGATLIDKNNLDDFIQARDAATSNK